MLFAVLPTHLTDRFASLSAKKSQHVVNPLLTSRIFDDVGGVRSNPVGAAQRRCSQLSNGRSWRSVCSLFAYCMRDVCSNRSVFTMLGRTGFANGPQQSAGAKTGSRACWLLPGKRYNDCFSRTSAVAIKQGTCLSDSMDSAVAPRLSQHGR